MFGTVVVIFNNIEEHKNSWLPSGTVVLLLLHDISKRKKALDRMPSNSLVCWFSLLIPVQWMFGPSSGPWVRKSGR